MEQKRSIERSTSPSSTAWVLMSRDVCDAYICRKWVGPTVATRYLFRTILAVDRDRPSKCHIGVEIQYFRGSWLEVNGVIYRCRLNWRTSPANVMRATVFQFFVAKNNNVKFIILILLCLVLSSSRIRTSASLQGRWCDLRVCGRLLLRRIRTSEAGEVLPDRGQEPSRACFCGLRCGIIGGCWGRT